MHVYIGRSRMQNWNSFHKASILLLLFTFIRKNSNNMIVCSWVPKLKLLKWIMGFHFGAKRLNTVTYQSPSSLFSLSLICTKLSSPKSIYCSCRINTTYALGRGKHAVCKMMGMMIKVKMNNRFLFSSFPSI